MTSDLEPRCVAWHLVTEPRDAGRMAADLSVLSPGERARHDQLASPDARRDFAAAHALLRSSLSRYAPLPPGSWRFVGGSHEKPRLSGECLAAAPLSFSLSHSKGLVACAITRGRDVGIDVERTDRRADAVGLAARFFSAAELDDLQACPPDGRSFRFTELWTLKEAFLKALGVGLAMSLSAASFDLRRPRTIRFVPPEGLSGTTWRFALFAPTDHHVMAVALRVEGPCSLDDPREAAFLARQAEPAGDGPPLVPRRQS